MNDMTLSFRNGLLTLAFSVIFLFVLGYGFLAFLLVSREGWGAGVGQGTLFQFLLQSVAAPLGSLVGFILVRQAYRKSAAPEAFFFALFLATLSAEALLVVQAWLHFADLPAFFTSVLTRVIWAFRITGLFLLFCGSLFSFEFSFRKYGNLVGASVAAGIFLATLLPLHSTSARNHLLFAVGDAPGLVLVTLLLALVVALNYLLGARRPGAPPRAWTRAWAAVFFLASWGLAIVMGPWGTLLAGPGILLASWKAEQNTLLS